MNKKRNFALIFLLCFIIIITSSYFIFINWFPATLSIIKGSETSLNFSFPFELYINSKKNSNLKVNGKKISDKFLRVDTGSPVRVKGEKIGSSSLNFKLFGLIPLRTVKINVLPKIKVYPGGQAIGVLIRSKGVMVVGKSFVADEKGRHHFPAREAGIEVGDIILKINGRDVNDKVDLASKIQKLVTKDSVIKFTIKKKKGNMKTVNVSPVKNKRGTYMIGLYVDDGVAGVGTLTFYKPETKEYGALGHIITENNGQIKVNVRKGHIVEAQISGINYSRKGTPGEKQGTFFNANDILGKITKNTDYGIYGKLKRFPENPYFDEAIPVAAISQVKTGPAKIYTVVRGGRINEYRIKISRVYQQSIPGPKGMIISITDPELKKMTGGIIQGMSGSPIIQNGRLVGAVTHVFVNNPYQGYGVFAEWMLLQTEIFKQARAVNY